MEIGEISHPDGTREFVVPFFSESGNANEPLSPVACGQSSPSTSAGAKRPLVCNAGTYWWMMLGVVAIVAALAVALWIDCPLAAWCVADGCPSGLAHLLKAIEPFGNGVGVIVIAIAVYQLDPRRRPMIARLIALSLGAGLAADGLKMLVMRVRPKAFDFHGGVAQTFGQWFPLLSEPSGGQSFPSAHTATAVGLAIGLSWLYPRGRGLFVALALLVACQRIESGYHFASDTVVGAAVGLLVALALLKIGLAPSWFERLESRLAARQALVSLHY